MLHHLVSAKSFKTMGGLVLLGLGLVVLAAFALRGCTDCWVSDDGLPRVATSRYFETGDLAELNKRGKLRILLLNETNDRDYLPRAGSTLDFELRAASEFARQMGLEPVIVYAQNQDDLIPALNAGKADLIAANLNITPELKQQIAITVPLMHIQQVVLTRVSDTQLQSDADLRGRILAVRHNSPYWDTAQQLLEQHPGLRFHVLPSDMSDQRKLQLLAAGKIDLTLHDDWAFELARDSNSGLRSAFPVSAAQSIAWGVRLDAVKLKEQLDRYINQAQLTTIQRQRYTGDLAEIRERKVLRVVTRNNAATYFLWRGELLGFEYEMAREFARQQKLRLEMIVAPEWSDVVPMLLNGQADIAAAFLTPNALQQLQGVAFSTAYDHVSQVVVSRSDDEDINSLDDLRGRTFHVRQSSAYWQLLRELQDKYGFDMVATPEDEEVEVTVDRVAQGDYDLTVADSNILDIELTWRDDIKAAFPLATDVNHAWAMRTENKELQAAVNAYLKKQYRSAFYNLAYDKYFRSESRIRQHRVERVDLNPDGAFSDYDELIKKYALEYGFDWRMLVAQMYEESRFDPGAISWAGAQGLMQVLPVTAEQLGIQGDLKDPDVGVHAGIAYLSWVRERFESELPVQDRMWFALAGYNAGAGHVRDARRLASAKGWDPDRWFGNVERAMLLLSRSEHASDARHGYVRGRESVSYVRNIKERYDAYLKLTGTATPASWGIMRHARAAAE